MEELNNPTPFVDAEYVYDKKIVSTPKADPITDIDLDNTFYDNIIGSGTNSTIDLAEIEKFTRISQNRNDVYNLIDTMAQDSIISAVLETYAEDATEYNDNMNIVWAESTDPEIASYITFLLDSLKVDKNIFTWAYSLIKYGDIYLRLYRESAYQDSLFKKTKRKRDLQEAIKLNAYPKSDKYVHYAELVKNPANIFSLSKFGKTIGYI